MADNLIYDDDEVLTLEELHRTYKNDFPLLIVVTDGFYGVTKYNDLASSQILLVAKCARQRRVLTDIRGNNYLSIPLSTNVLFQVVGSNGKKGHPSELRNIIERNNYPVTVQCALDQNLKISGETKNTDNLGKLRLTKDYQEIYLCCHCVNNGEIRTNVNLFVLSDDITCAIVTGIKNKSNREFKHYMKKLMKDIADVSYDTVMGNPDITQIPGGRRFQQSSTGQGKEKRKPLPPIPVGNNSEISSEDSDYECPINQESSENYEEPISPSKSYDDDGYISANSLPPGSPGACAPPLPPRQKTTSQLPKTTIGSTTISHGHKNNYVNTDLKSDKTERKPKEMKGNGNKETQTNKKAGEQKEKKWLQGLLIADVGNILRQLNLSKYVDKFAEELVDGATLARFDEELLMKEFHFSRTESIRLTAFIHSGHIPS